ncbi:MEX67 [Candida oxycetoniae]|uniref:MEX67 n=1 Tax=Candida oxycetoniae TaxID=497107 RepID=A0AAI9WZA7_9ASCO|nr:MEX67 [Candida oxycetoniae]KAI3405993.2 MEX67 [Candida oxycetoniae]
MSYRGRGRGGDHNGNYNNNNHQGRGSLQQNIDTFVDANAYPVEIVGWNGASSTDCINFISRKCRVIVSNYTVDKNTGVLKGYVKNESQANTLLTWSGVKFAGQSLRFSKGPSTLSNQMGGANPGQNNTIEVITGFLKSRYRPDLKMLNLSNVKQDPNLNAQGFFGSLSVTSKFFPALMKIASDLKLDVVSIDLSNNELTDLQSLSYMAQTFPKLQNLSLSNNQFSKIKVFETWRHKLNFLRELILFNNPLLQNSNPAEIHAIKLELMRAFPRLVVLNGEIVRNEQILNANSTFPFEAPQAMFFQDDEIRTLSTNFIASFLNLWDTNRVNLMVLYQNESQFSMQVDSSHPFLIDENNSSSNDYGNYLSNSRNLTRVSSAKSRLEKVAVGPEAIYKLFQQLPGTKHDISTKPEVFSMECYKFPVLNGILITIHGCFEETAQPEVTESHDTRGAARGNARFHSYNRPKKVALSKKSFDRTFLVIPGPNGNMIVASDLLLVRPFSNEVPWTQIPAINPNPTTNPNSSPTPTTGINNTNGLVPQGPFSGSPALQGGALPPPPPAAAAAAAAAAAVTPTASDLPPEIKSRLQPGQQEILVKIVIETKLNLQYALLLCEQSNWNYDESIMNFKNSANSLPRDAFV